MRVSKHLGWGLCLTLIVLSACQSEKIDNSMIVEPVDEVSFAADIQPILTNSCGGFGCHVGESTNGVEVSNYAQVMTSQGLQYGGLIVIPGNGAESPLVDKLGLNPRFPSRMPLGAAPLTATQISLIRTWIDEGAQDN